MVWGWVFGAIVPHYLFLAQRRKDKHNLSELRAPFSCLADSQMLCASIMHGAVWLVIYPTGLEIIPL